MKTRRVLVIDDESSIREYCSEALSVSGYEVDMVADAVSGLHALGQERYDVVLLDVKMPGAGGLEVLSSMRSRGDETTVVIMTGFGTIETVTEALHAGASGFILKPFTVQDVTHAVENALSLSTLREESFHLRVLFPLFGAMNELSRAHDEVALLKAVSRIAHDYFECDRMFFDIIDDELRRRIGDSVPLATPR